MSTRAEQFKSDAQRTGDSEAAAKPAAHEPSGSAAKRATYAREEQSATGQPSRKSTRKSANHAKTDTGALRAEQMKQNTPEARFARLNAHAKGGAHGVSK